MVLLFRPIMAIPAMSATRRLHDVGKVCGSVMVFPTACIGMVLVGAFAIATDKGTGDGYLIFLP